MVDWNKIHREIQCLFDSNEENDVGLDVENLEEKKRVKIKKKKTSSSNSRQTNGSDRLTLNTDIERTIYCTMISIRSDTFI